MPSVLSDETQTGAVIKAKGLGVPMERISQLVVGVLILLLCIGGAFATTAAAVISAQGEVFSVVLPLVFGLASLAAVVAATRDLLGRPSHRLGLGAIGLLVFLGLWFFLTSPTSDPTWVVTLAMWFVAGTLWAVLAGARSPRDAAAAAPPETAL